MNQLMKLGTIFSFVLASTSVAQAEGVGDWAYWYFANPPWGIEGEIKDTLLDQNERTGDYFLRSVLYYEGEERVSEKWVPSNDLYRPSEVDKILADCDEYGGKKEMYTVKDMGETFETCRVVLGQIQSVWTPAAFLQSRASQGSQTLVWVGHAPVFGMFQSMDLVDGGVAAITQIKSFAFAN